MSDAMEPMFHILSLKWSRGECFLWWRAGGAGYTLALDDAGTFDAAHADSICAHAHADVAAIPVEAVQRCSSRVVLDSDREQLLAMRRPAKET